MAGLDAIRPACGFGLSRKHHRAVRRIESHDGLHTQGRLATCAYEGSPMAWGLFRPAIVLPNRFFKQFTPAEQRVVLAHELAHLTSRDPEWYSIADLCRTLLWWHPAIWWARRRLHQTSEMAADEASLLFDGGAVFLAECLVRVGGQLLPRKIAAGLGIGGSRYKSGLGRRVDRCTWKDADGSSCLPFDRLCSKVSSQSVPLGSHCSPWRGQRHKPSRKEKPPCEICDKSGDHR